ncbi:MULTISPECIES: putative 4-hydroxy-4-methyl-2-oxoglutarate aldolase [Salinivibrio]|uniref:4-hydroxy-4-methyl-2-oxoglutarate aldolase n=1 Tax=Salinivibrio kushneri TaxID=1908198 RepID=A0AB36K9N5_9GAMM|nr:MULTISPECIES: putative 4-hydroxy-4-methyl-2-oxoglutarate aldolase [Salinivibrio]ODP95709.1 ribonuclease activity regulator protein RraA [Salinivibrio sp. BNH]OOE35320.1 ribonuclease activity regulator protein RraA [Salinivibrio kushneri]OOE36305.1 ribonuclease activity regulator protein RraA [Salinivibrio kushneri]OOE40412.1 ribonuclease activity regulator protein RraA [Salinivibrio kushneri]OOE42005.1 ribonuclease activity regulator protein RraA [Salinivibrio kushneri]
MDDKLPDLCDNHPEAVQWLPVQWQDYGGKRCFEGRVRTVRCHHDNSKVKAMLATRGEGQVLVVDGSGAMDRALLGDLIAQSAVDNGWAGVVIAGPVRDAATLATLPIGIKALGVCPIKTQKRDQGEVDVALALEGVSVMAGHYLYADANGVVVCAEPLTG